MFVSKFVKKLKPYVTTSHLAWELKDHNHVLKLDWNEADYPPSPRVIKALSEFVISGKINWYPDTDNAFLKKSLSAYTSLDLLNIETFSSSDATHEYIVRCFLESGDKLLVLGPSYDNFRAVVESVGCTVDFFYRPRSSDFVVDLFAFTSYIEDLAPKAVYICSPNNPTGDVFSLEQIENLLRKFNDVLFIVDEAYYEYCNKTASSLVAKFENIIICRTFSKAFALASLRFGYILSSETNVRNLRKVKNFKSVNSFAQIAAIATLESLDYYSNKIKEVISVRFYLQQSFSELGFYVVPSEANFLLMSHSKFNIHSLAEFLEKNNIFVRRFYFGGTNYIRISIPSVANLGILEKKVCEFCLLQS